MLALVRMVLPRAQVELDHLPDVAATPARHQVAPFAVQIDEREVNESVHDEHPHHREVPVARAAEPAAERQPRRDRPSNG